MNWYSQSRETQTIRIPAHDFTLYWMLLLQSSSEADPFKGGHCVLKWVLDGHLQGNKCKRENLGWIESAESTKKYFKDNLKLDTSCCISFSKKCPCKTHFYTWWRRDFLSLGEAFFSPVSLFLLQDFYYFLFCCFCWGTFSILCQLNTSFCSKKIYFYQV